MTNLCFVFILLLCYIIIYTKSISLIVCVSGVLFICMCFVYNFLCSKWIFKAIISNEAIVHNRVFISLSYIFVCILPLKNKNIHELSFETFNWSVPWLKLTNYVKLVSIGQTCFVFHDHFFLNCVCICIYVYYCYCGNIINIFVSVYSVFSHFC